MSTLLLLGCPVLRQAPRKWIPGTTQRKGRVSRAEGVCVHIWGATEACVQVTPGSLWEWRGARSEEEQAVPMTPPDRGEPLASRTAGGRLQQDGGEAPSTVWWDHAVLSRAMGAAASSSRPCRRAPVSCAWGPAKEPEACLSVRACACARAVTLCGPQFTSRK